MTRESIRFYATRDASVDELNHRDDGARSAFMRRGNLPESTWSTYRDAYEAAMTRYCDAARARNAVRVAQCWHDGPLRHGQFCVVCERKTSALRASREATL